MVVGIPASARWPATSLVQEAHATAARLYGPPPWQVVVARHAQLPATQELSATAIPGGVIEEPFEPRPGDELRVPYHGLPGRARAVRAIFKRALDSGARICVIVDPRTRDLGTWLDQFISPMRDLDVHFVSPIYARHPFASGLVHGILSPIFGALYGVRVRWPLGLHFGCSARLVEAALDSPFWETDRAEIGIEQWLLANAIESRLGVAQAAVSPQDVSLDVDLGTAIAQVVGSLFTEMERRARVWQRVRGLRQAPTFGAAVAAQPPAHIDSAAMLDTFRGAYRDMEDIWCQILPPLCVLQWRRLAASPLHVFRVADALWARTLYDFAMGFRLRPIARDHLLRSLAPLYLAWLASLTSELQGASVEAIEQRLDRLSVAFAAEKPYLVSQWRWPERFRPVKVRR